jgi:hypothetical protein
MKLLLKRVFLFSVVVVGLNLIFGDLLFQKYRDWKKLGVYFDPMRLKEFNGLEPNTVNTLVLGSSHAYRSYNPFLLDSLVPGTKTFNLGSSGQTYRTSYALLNYALARQPYVKTVILDIYFLSLFEKEQLNNGLHNYLHLEGFEDKYKFYLSAFTFREQALLLLFPTYVYRGNVNYLLNKCLRRGQEKLPKGEYFGNGFVSSYEHSNSKTYVQEDIFSNYLFQANLIHEPNILYLNKLVNLCNEKGIRLVFCATPLPNGSVRKIKDINAIKSYYAGMKTNYKVEFFDYSFSNELNFKDTIHFYDNNHLNRIGADIFTEEVMVKKVLNNK